MHYYVVDRNNRVLSDATSYEQAHVEGSRIRRETGVETFVRGGLWSQWEGAPTDRAMSPADRDAEGV